MKPIKLIVLSMAFILCSAPYYHNSLDATKKKIESNALIESVLKALEDNNHCYDSFITDNYSKHIEHILNDQSSRVAIQTENFLDMFFLVLNSLPNEGNKFDKYWKIHLTTALAFYHSHHAHLIMVCNPFSINESAIRKKFDDLKKNKNTDFFNNLNINEITTTENLARFKSSSRKARLKNNTPVLENYINEQKLYKILKSLHNELSSFCFKLKNQANRKEGKDNDNAHDGKKIALEIYQAKGKKSIQKLKNILNSQPPDITWPHHPYRRNQRNMGAFTDINFEF